MGQDEDEMKLYAVVEGERTEPALCRAWLPQLIPGMEEVERLEDLCDQSYYLVAGQGYPSYLKRVEDACADLADRPDVHLLVWIDAEELTVAQRHAEVAPLLGAVAHRTTLLVANCCVETWLLGNDRLVARQPQSQVLRDFLAHYDVVDHDPEQLPHRPQDRNRASTHLAYLRAAFLERNLSYTKKNPGHAADPAYLDALRRRLDREHIPSMAPLFNLRS